MTNRGTVPRGSLLEIFKRSIRGYKRDDVSDRAAALTYYGVLALFPAVLVIVAVLGLLGKSTTQKMLNNLGQATPSSVSGFLRSVVSQVQGHAGAASLAGIIGIVIALWSASGYVAAFMRAANSIYSIDEGRPIWKTAPLRLVTTVGLVVMIVIGAVIVVVTGPIATHVGTAIGMGHAAVMAWDIAKWPVLVVLVGAMLALLYLATPNVKQPGMKSVWAGVVLALVIWMIASGAFAVYLGFSSSYNKTYGSLATVIIFLVWLWITNSAVLLGAEFNAEWQREVAIRAGLPAEVEPFAELRDTRKLEDAEKKRVESAGRIRRRLLDRRDH
jgi:membrane protein